MLIPVDKILGVETHLLYTMELNLLYTMELKAKYCLDQDAHDLGFPS